ncbi:TetR/AcrR family transcriptional regulator [Saccharopolyspora sp. 5N708]|uniref:TetR/AcrR family transcriptional regulator n=1 Tax=Saccharopolyspora sp. 5N708 TaxID=3457424 RepID=UPI003FD667B8
MGKVLTAKGAATRARIIEGAAELLREHSVENTTLDHIRTHTATSKSQLFHYFPEGKEQLLLAVAEYEAERVLDDQQPYLGDLSTWTAWYQWRDALIKRYTAMGDTCPLGSLFLQIGRHTPGAQAIVRGLMRRWQNALAAGMRSLQQHGRLPESFDVERAAAALLSALQGGVTLMLSTGRSDHLKAALDYNIEQLRLHAPSRAAAR